MLKVVFLLNRVNCSWRILCFGLGVELKKLIEKP